MAKKKKRSLTERIAALINRVGEKPEPTFGDIKSELVECLGLAETLENDSVIRDLEAQATVLEAALEKSNLENSNLQSDLQSLKTEVDGFRAERKKQDEKERQKEMPEIQFKILQRLPSENEGDGATLKGISRRANIGALEAEIHLDRLEKAGFAKRRYFASAGDSRITAWYRTIPGNELILAKRLAGEGEPEKEEVQERPDLTKMEMIVLMTVAKRREGMTAPEIVERVNKSIPAIGKPIASLPLVQLLLIKLREKNLATDGHEPDSGTGRRWVALAEGIELLDERGFL